MYDKGTVVIHPGMGVCEITDYMSQTINNTARKFYVLKPLFDKNSTTVYVPVDSDKIILRRPITKEDILNVLKTVDDLDDAWIEDDAERRNTFTEILKSGNHTEIIRIMGAVYHEKKKRESMGKRLRVSDERFLEEAQRLIHEELAYTMDLDIGSVENFIISALGDRA